MLNLVEKFSTRAAKKQDEGVVAIEYVLVAAAVAAGVIVVFAVGPWDKMADVLNGLFD